MTKSCSVHKRRSRISPALVSVLLMMALATMGDRKVSGQPPSAQPLGPYVADFLLGVGGALDGTGAGARSLATGSTITTASTYFAGWGGTLTATAPVLLGAYREWHRTHVQTSPPPQGQYAEWYNDGSYFFQVYYQNTAPDPYATYCGVQAPGGTPVYFIYTRSSVTFTECGTVFGDWAFPGPAMVLSTVQSAFSKFRGRGGLNPSAPPDQNNANIWAREWIDSGKWASDVKPALDAAIRTAVTSADLQALGITGNPPIDEPPQARRIAIDAGHGQDCPGTGGVTPPIMLEDVLVYEIALQVKADFEARRHTVVWTRPSPCDTRFNRKTGKYEETRKSLESRVDTAIGNGADIFVSVHMNGFTDPTWHGTEAWYESTYGDPGDITDSLILAGRIVDQQVLLELYRRGIKRNRIDKPDTIWILEYARNRLPLGTVVDEVAFLTNTSGNPSDETRLRDPAFLVRVANAIENAIRQSLP